MAIKWIEFYIFYNLHVSHENSKRKRKSYALNKVFYKYFKEFTFIPLFGMEWCTKLVVDFYIVII